MYATHQVPKSCLVWWAVGWPRSGLLVMFFTYVTLQEDRQCLDPNGIFEVGILPSMNTAFAQVGTVKINTWVPIDLDIPTWNYFATVTQMIGSTIYIRLYVVSQASGP